MSATWFYSKRPLAKRPFAESRNMLLRAKWPSSTIGLITSEEVIRCQCELKTDPPAIQPVDGAALFHNS